MTYSVARDYLAHNIRCNCISPARVHYAVCRRLSAEELPRPRKGNVREAGEVATNWKNGGAGRSCFPCIVLVLRRSRVHYRRGLSHRWRLFQLARLTLWTWN